MLLLVVLVGAVPLCSELPFALVGFFFFQFHRNSTQFLWEKGAHTHRADIIIDSYGVKHTHISTVLQQRATRFEYRVCSIVSRLTPPEDLF